MLGGRGGGQAPAAAPVDRVADRGEERSARAEPAGVAESFDDDIPF